MRKVIQEGGIYPRFYGPAWDDLRINCDRLAIVVCYPIPINLILRWIRQLYLWLEWNTRRISNQDKLQWANDKIKTLQKLLVIANHKHDNSDR